MDLCHLKNAEMEPQIQKYVDTRHQLAGILTDGNFTRDEWKNFLNNLLYLFYVSHFMNGTTFLICVTSAISDQFAALRISALTAAQK